MHALAEKSELHRKSLPWIFYGQTTSLCETCFELVPAKIIGEDGKVFYQKRCSQHGVMKTLIEEDADYWLGIRHWLKPGDRPLHHASRTWCSCRAANRPSIRNSGRSSPRHVPARSAI